MVFSGGLPALSHFGNVGEGSPRLWNLCRLCPALLFSGSTIVLEGDIVAPNKSPPVIW